MIWINEDQRKKALKSFTAFLVECNSSIFHWKTGNYKCDKCDGLGRIVSPWAYNDPVEGYKMADRVDCPHCNGTGESNEKAWREIYKKEKEFYVERRTKAREKDAIIRGALNKLTKEEIQTLGINYK